MAEIESPAASEASIRSILAAMTEGLVLHGSNGRIIDCNPAAEGLLGASRAQLLGTPSADPRWQPVREDGSPLPLSERPEQVTLRTGQPVHGQLIGVSLPARGQRWFSVNSSPIWGTDTRVPEVVVVTFSDITERRQIEERLLAMAREQERLLDNDLVGIVKVQARRMLWANRGMVRMFGYEVSELVGQVTRLIYATDEGFEAVGQFVATQRVGESYRVEAEMRRKDGQILTVDLQIARLSDETDDFMGILVDITPIRQAEAARLRTVQLEAENDRRLVEIQEERKLRLQSQHHAQQLDRLLKERSEMLDVLAHEVRQPLNNASAALQGARAALAGIDEPKASPGLQRAEIVLARVNATIDNHLAVASLLARPIAIERQDIDVDTLVAVAIGDIPEASRTRVRVVRATDTRTASMDTSLMRLALRNLLDNALRHSAPDSPVIVRLADSDRPLALVIDVIDAGEGIPPEMVPHLFERGRARRPVGAPPRKGPGPGAGLGLGLYIVRRVMDLHGGSVQVLHNGPGGVTIRLLVLQAGE